MRFRSATFRMSKATVGLALTCVTITSIAFLGLSQSGFARPSAPQGEVKLRVASYNIEWFSEEAREDRISNLKSVLKNIQPNILAFQEVQSKRAVKQFLDDGWEIAMLDDKTEDQEVGIAVRQPLKLVSSEMVFKDTYYDYAFPGKRDVLKAVVETPSGVRFSVYSLHMKSRSGGRLQTDPQREFGAALLAGYLRGLKNENHIVMGDLNDSPDDVSVNILESGDLMAKGGPVGESRLLVNLMQDLYRKDGVTHGLARDYRAGSNIQPFTPGAMSENERTRGIDYKFPDDLKTTHILFDQILVSPSLAEGAKATIYSADDALRGQYGTTRRNDEGRAEYVRKPTRASDHCPVFADLVFKAR